MDPRLLQQIIAKFGPQAGKIPDELPSQLTTAEEMESPGSKTQQMLDVATSKASDAYDRLEAPRTKAIDIVAKQLDLNKKGDPEFQSTARTILDAGLPNVADVAMLGGAKLIPKIAEAASAFGKLGTLKNEVGAVGRAEGLANAANSKYGKLFIKPTAQEIAEKATLEAQKRLPSLEERMQIARLKPGIKY